MRQPTIYVTTRHNNVIVTTRNLDVELNPKAAEQLGRTIITMARQLDAPTGATT